MIKYYCDTCSEVTKEYTMNADTYAITCIKCIPKISTKEDTECVDLTIKSTQGSWERRTNLDRKKYSKSILQPFTAKGQVNSKFVDEYGAGIYKKEFGRPDVTDYYEKKGTTRQQNLTREYFKNAKR